MSTLFLGTVVKSEIGPPRHTDLLSILDAQDGLSEVADLIEEGMTAEALRGMLASDAERARLWSSARESFAALLDLDLEEQLELLRRPRIDDDLELKLMEARFAWLIASVVQGPAAVPPAHHLSVELAAIHPGATLPVPGPGHATRSFARHVLFDVDKTAFDSNRQWTRLSRFGKDACYDPWSHGEKAGGEAAEIVWLSHHTGEEERPPRSEALARALKKQRADASYVTVVDLWFHPCWLQSLRTGPFDSTAHVDP